MVLTPLQLTSFFTVGTQMGLTAVQRNALAAQGLATTDDFADFGKDELKEALKNMRTSIPGIPAVVAVAAARGIAEVAAVDAVPAIPPIVLPAKSTHRLEVASLAWHYYTDTSRTVTSTNMHYNNVLKDFYVEWKAINSMASTSPADIPCITKNNPPLRWTDTFMDYCLNTFGVRQTPLAYVLRDKVEVLPETVPLGDTSPTDTLLLNCAYGLGGSVLNDLIARMSHTHPLYKTDNAKVYSALEEATRSTAYSSTVKAFSRRRDGRAAWLALVNSHAGSDKWESLQKENVKWLLNTKWNGRVYTLEKFCNQHRSRFVNLEEAQNHVDFQLPTEHTRVGYLIDNIENPDADLRAAIANIRQNVNNTRSNFENAIGVLLPVDPYAKYKRRNGGPAPRHDGGNANISSTYAADKDNSNGGIGSSGVHLRFHKLSEYNQLTPAQKDELYQWRQTQNGKKYTTDERKKRKAPLGNVSSSNTTNNTEKSIKSAVKAAIAHEKKKQKKESDDVLEIATVIANASPASSTISSATTATATAVTQAHKEAALKLIKIKQRANAAKSNDN